MSYAVQLENTRAEGRTQVFWPLSHCHFCHLKTLSFPFLLHNFLPSPSEMFGNQLCACHKCLPVVRAVPSTLPPAPLQFRNHQYISACFFMWAPSEAEPETIQVQVDYSGGDKGKIGSRWSEKWWVIKQVTTLSNTGIPEKQCRTCYSEFSCRRGK